MLFCHYVLGTLARRACELRLWKLLRSKAVFEATMFSKVFELHARKDKHRGPLCCSGDT